MLRKILGLNAAFSTINGIAMLFAPTFLAAIFFDLDFALFGMSGAEIFQILAMGLFLFAAYVGFVAFKLPQLMGQVKIIILADWSWVISTILLLVFASSTFSTFGLVFFAIVALIVAGFALAQRKSSNSVAD